jgi:S1-C subfamily serine protease
MTQGPSESVPSRPVRSRTFAALAAAALLGGGAALGGAAGLGAFGEEGAATVEAAVPASATAASVAAPAGGLTPAEIYRRAASGVVQVNTRGAGGGGQGSGFVIDKAGHIVTNYHVIQGATSIEVSFSSQDTLEATLVGEDPATDLALLRVAENPRGLTPLRLGDSDALEVGEPVVAIGNPFGLERTLTAGIVSALERGVRAPNGVTTIDHVIQTDAPINHGNSGGPLLNDAAEVIGVNSQIETGGSGEGNVGIGFAVPSNTVKSVVAQLQRSGKVEHAFLGIAARSVTEEVASTYRLPATSGLLVQTVTPGSGAEKAGLRAGTETVVLDGESYVLGGDIIVAAAGRPVTDIEALRSAVSARKPGDRLVLSLYRGQEKREVTVVLGRVPTSARP